MPQGRPPMVTTRYTCNDGVGLAYHLFSRWMLWRPRLVLIQGVGFDAGGWDPVLRRLGRDFRWWCWTTAVSGTATHPLADTRSRPWLPTWWRYSMRSVSSPPTSWGSAWVAWSLRSWPSATQDA